MDRLLQSPRRLPPAGRGQEDSAPAFLLPESRPVLQARLPALTPLLVQGWRGSDSFLHHPHPWPSPRPGTKGKLKPWTQDHSYWTSLSQLLFCAQRGGDMELRATWSLFSRGMNRQNIAAEVC